MLSHTLLSNPVNELDILYIYFYIIYILYIILYYNFDILEIIYIFLLDIFFLCGAQLKGSGAVPFRAQQPSRTYVWSWYHAVDGRCVLG